MFRIVWWWVLGASNFGCAALDYLGGHWPLFFINSAFGLGFAYLALESRADNHDL
jgi:hypothetical protein